MIENGNMTFKEDTKRFVLTDYYVENELGIALEKVLTDTEDTYSQAQRVLKRVSNQIYNFIQTNACDYESSLYYIAHNFNANMGIQQAMSYQLEKVLMEGDASLLEGKTSRDGISSEAIDVLKGCGVFTIVYMTKNWEV